VGITHLFQLSVISDQLSVISEHSPRNAHEVVSHLPAPLLPDLKIEAEITQIRQSY